MLENITGADKATITACGTPLVIESVVAAGEIVTVLVPGEGAV
jgi:hypothetical protein